MTFDPDLEPSPGAAGSTSGASSRRVEEVGGQVTDPGLFVSTFQLELHAGQDVVVYDQNSCGPDRLGPESFLSVVLLKLGRSFSAVHLLSGESRPGPLVTGWLAPPLLPQVPTVWPCPLRWLPGVLPAVPWSVRGEVLPGSFLHLPALPPRQQRRTHPDPASPVPGLPARRPEPGSSAARGHSRDPSSGSNGRL